MAILDEVVFKRSLEASERRLARARARRELQVKRFKLLCIVGLIFVVVISALSLARRTAPAPPLLVVHWPQPAATQVLPGSSTLLLRPGRPINVTVAPDAEHWSLSWITGKDQTSSGEIKWSSSQIKDTLKVRCRAHASGLQRLVAWLWPTHEIVLHGIRAESLDKFHRRVTPPPGGMWIFPHILAGSPVTWDERALPLLLQVTPVQPQPQSLKPEASWWSLRPSFDTAMADDGSTYALLSTFKFVDDFDAVRDLTQVARALARARPDASIKFVVRLDRNPAQGIMRLALDGKGERAAWVKRPGEATGGPLEWDRPHIVGEPLEPILPGSIPR
jgi:hypothetical protein